MTDLQSVALPLGYAASLDPEARETTRDEESVQPPTVASRANPCAVGIEDRSEEVVEGRVHAEGAVVRSAKRGRKASSFRFVRKESTRVPS